MKRNQILCLFVVGILGATVLLGVAGITVMGMHGLEAPHSLVAMVSASLVALSSLLMVLPKENGNTPASPGDSVPTQPK